ncbi:DUF1996 domain-containing protein [Streptomyces sp. NPDC051907]|uniref:DUF1996 domain-containing protein n=1 Tax=Streptomyces sp. NPDC051907 TaxID=3155284 RepID=UPI003429F0D7
MNQRHKVNRTRRKALIAVAGLVLGGGGLAAVNAGANATSPGGQQAASVVCPSVEERLPDIPAEARAEVSRDLRQMQQDVEAADARLSSGKGVSSHTVLDPLWSKRSAALERIEVAVERAGSPRPQNLASLTACTVGRAGASETKAEGDQQQGTGQPQATPSGPGAGQQGAGQPPAGEQGAGQQGAGQQVDNGPSPEDYVDITTVRWNVPKARNGRSASTGAFQSLCGVNEEGRFNSDNVIAAPGVANGAHHNHDYVGAVGVNAFTTNESLAAAQTTCTNGDQSTYYWPVLRDRDGVQESDADQQGGGAEGNIGRILTPVSVSLQFVGNPQSKVSPMPRFLRIITGDAKANANGGANANARYTCTGFENRVELRDKYPICPEGSNLIRVAKFQNCWDGRNTDSANHRTHVAFADARGRCPAGFRPIPQLVQRVVYSGLSGSTSFAVDSFPESFHKPITDHGDFINAMSDRMMKQAVKCINTGRRCG